MLYRLIQIFPISHKSGTQTEEGGNDEPEGIILGPATAYSLGTNQIAHSQDGGGGREGREEGMGYAI